MGEIKVISDKKFNEQMQSIQKIAAEHHDNNSVRCALIGYVASGAGEDWEIAYTESQLRQIFGLGFDGGWPRGAAGES